jgi:hypothetical protein
MQEQNALISVETLSSTGFVQVSLRETGMNVLETGSL